MVSTRQKLLRSATIIGLILILAFTVLGQPTFGVGARIVETLSVSADVDVDTWDDDGTVTYVAYKSAVLDMRNGTLADIRATIDDLDGETTPEEMDVIRDGIVLAETDWNWTDITDDDDSEGIETVGHQRTFNRSFQQPGRYAYITVLVYAQSYCQPINYPEDDDTVNCDWTDYDVVELDRDVYEFRVETGDLSLFDRVAR